MESLTLPLLKEVWVLESGLVLGKGFRAIGQVIQCLPGVLGVGVVNPLNSELEGTIRHGLVL